MVTSGDYTLLIFDISGKDWKKSMDRLGVQKVPVSVLMTLVPVVQNSER
jgi:hypothetical protein